MTTEKFIELCLQDIQSGIEGFNKENTHHHAEMPPNVTFELKVVREDGNAKMAEAGDIGNHINTIHLTINVQYFRHNKNLTK